MTHKFDHLILPERPEPMMFLWPIPGVGVGFWTFATTDEWRDFIFRLDLHPAVPLIVLAKYLRAQKLYYLSWMDTDIVKAGELVALTALELALNDVYGGKHDLPGGKLLFEKEKRKQRGQQEEPDKPAKDKKPKKRKKTFGEDFALLLFYMVERDGLTDNDLPSVKRMGNGSAIGRLTGESKPSLSEIRNELAHGYPFDGLPKVGLIELVRDLIHYAYRDRIAEAAAKGGSGA
jgi:hypothetical protein